MRRFQHGTSGVDVDVDTDDDDDNVDAVDIDRVLGFQPVKTVDNAWGGGRAVRLLRSGRRRRGGTVCHVVGVLIILHERAI